MLGEFGDEVQRIEYLHILLEILGICGVEKHPQFVRLEEMRACAPDLPAGWLVRTVDDRTIAEAHDIGLTQLCPEAKTVTHDLVRCLHAEGFVARAWGVTTEARMRQVVDAGADWMTVNFPDKLIAYLQEQNLAWE